MPKIQKLKKFDLEDRTFTFANEIREFAPKVQKNMINIDDIKQLIRSSGSVGANYIEANESLGKKDFLLGIKICRKEIKESIYWLRLLSLNNDIILEQNRERLIKEATELMKIFGSIVSRTDI